MARSAPLLESLGNKIQSQVLQVQQYLSESEQADPSFDGLAKVTDYTGIEDLRNSLLDNLIELQDLLSTPLELLQAKFVTEYISRQAIDRFDIIQSVPTNKDISYDLLAETTGISAKLLRTFIRHSATQRVFYEPRPNYVAHTQASRLLAENSPVRDYFGTICNEVWPAATRVCDAIATYPHPRNRDQSAYFLAKGMTFYDALAADPVRQHRHDNAFGAFVKDPAFSLQHVVDNFDWAALGSAVVVDVGGGIGTLSKILADSFPLLRCIVQDTPQVIAAAHESNDRYVNRIEYMAHDFFTPQPFNGASVYLFRRVMMDWSDEQVVQILRNLVPALSLGATILIVDSHVPEPGTCPLWLERRFRNSDLIGLAIASTEKREIGEWETFFKAAGPGFAFVKVKHVKNTEIVLAEATWRGG